MGPARYRTPAYPIQTTVSTYQAEHHEEAADQEVPADEVQADGLIDEVHDQSEQSLNLSRRCFRSDA